MGRGSRTASSGVPDVAFTRTYDLTKPTTRLVHEYPLKAEITMEDVKERCSGTDQILVVIDGEVYDLTAYAPNHPGGHKLLSLVAGNDTTPFFRMYHPDYVYEKLHNFHVASVINYKRDPVDQAYMDLDAKLRSSGVYKTRMSYFSSLLSSHVIFFSLSLLIGWFYGSTMGGVVLSAIFMGLFWQQFAFLGHDLLHNGVTHDRKKDVRFCATFGMLTAGISSGWWMWTHNSHHVVCNSADNDPDIQHLPVFAVSPRFFFSIFSKFHERVFSYDAVSRWFVKRQHYLYYPIMAVARFNLCLQSWLFLLNPSNQVEYRATEILGGLGFFSWMYFFLGWSFESARNRIVWLLISHALAGILHVQITLSHFAMDIYGDTFKESSTPHASNFVQTQLATTMDVDCYPWMDWFHGGLQFQAVHHLFPRVPRHNLRELQKTLVAFCDEHKLKYVRVSFLEGNKMVIRRLAEVAKATDIDLRYLKDALNVVG